MGALPFIIGGGALVALLAVASKAKAKASTTSSTTPTATSTGVAAPAYLDSVPYLIAMRVIQMSDPSMQQAQGVWLTSNGYPKTGEAIQRYSRGEITDIELRQTAMAEFEASTATSTASIPAQIVEAVLKGSSQTIAQGQAIWLNDNGYPKTAEALRDYLEGELSLDELRAIAASEVKTAPAVLTPSKPTGVNTRDLYGESLLSAGTNDEILSYAQGSDSIPFVTAAAAHLAAAGDTRAMLLTQHLVDITT